MRQQNEKGIGVNTNSYLAFLVISVVLVVIDGQLIYRSGRAYLEQAYGTSGSARSVTHLVVVLFHLVVLGLIALLSTIPMDTGSQVRDVVVQLGVVLLLLAAAHGATIGILSRIREQHREDKITEDIVERRQQKREWGTHPTANPVSDGPEKQAAVSPSIDQHGPYTSTG
ncbi:MAG: hypothetical protein GEU98_08325 [Pseudonocardiaceae bacterium]|nr:hypothetical protein [Pseudonocardiaceae bacterium]